MFGEFATVVLFKMCFETGKITQTRSGEMEHI